MGLLYIVVAALVMCLLLAVPVFPFWKVWKRLKANHPDLWTAKGPFEVRDMAAHPERIRGFLDIVALADKDETLMSRDPELIKWTRFAREVWRMTPRALLGRIGYLLVLVYFVVFFTSSIVGAIKTVIGAQ
ncbi:MAG TPA: hypothetical protein VEF76_06080 [Patescibacteria group bacterium]|nr:hypothetical protein [Patescibacteria group bacterium]